MANNKEHLEVTSHEQSTIIFLGLRDKLSRTVLRGLVEGESWLVDDLAQGSNSSVPTSGKSETEPQHNPEDAPDGGRTVILDEFLRSEEEEPFDGEAGDDYFSTVLKVDEKEVSVVFGPDPTVYALPRQEVLSLIDQQQPD
jgi:hypothetical protein